MSSMTLLFQGDSITDAGRSRDDDTQLGNGYVGMIAARLMAHFEGDLKVYNRGIGGNRADDLEARWEEDTIALEPDVVSILVGINDVYQSYDGRSSVTAETYKQCCDRILTRITDTVKARIILLEPFLLPSNDTARERIPSLFPFIAAIREVAAKHRTQYIPLDGLFAAHASKKSSSFYAQDGVHPTQAGHALITDYWLKAFYNT